jgi:hypothetical protein
MSSSCTLIDVPAAMRGHTAAVFEARYVSRTNGDRIREQANPIIRAA